MWKGSSTAKLHPGEKALRVITSTFITRCMVDCILYCSGTSRPIHLHWLSYSRQLYGSGKEYQREMSGWFGWPFTFLRTAVVIVVSLLLPPFSIIILLKYLGRNVVFYRQKNTSWRGRKTALKRSFMSFFDWYFWVILFLRCTLISNLKMSVFLTFAIIQKFLKVALLGLIRRSVNH